jgi:cytochrome c-type biogenesis protein CcmH
VSAVRALAGAALALGLLAGTPAPAVQPDEMLADPVQEQRARELSRGLRCLVCRNESIDDSNADLAKTLRVLVRERIAAGDSDDDALAYIVDRYGEYVLLTPRLTPANALIWLSGPLLLAGGGWLAWRFVKTRERAAAGRPGPAPLTPEEERRLAEILKG